MTKPYTVIGVHADNGQICCHHVTANDGLHAFAVTAATVAGNLDMVVAIEGHLKESVNLTFSGECLVDTETILDQPDVFGHPATTD